MAQVVSRIVEGTPVVAGIVYGRARWMHQPTPIFDSGQRIAGQYWPRENLRFVAAAITVADRLEERSHLAVGPSSDLLQVAAAFARDKAWHHSVESFIHQGYPAELATQAATTYFVRQFQRTGGLIAQRVADLIDVRNRVVAQLRGEPEPGLPCLDQPCILLANDLAPADTAGLDPNVVLAIATRQGTPTSHSAIIARQLGIPYIVGASRLALIDQDTPLLFNADLGTIELNPDPDQASELAQSGHLSRLDALALAQQQASHWHGPTHLASGEKVELLTNAQDVAGVQAGLLAGADGVGLFRTELAFLDSVCEPKSDTQSQLYFNIFEAANTHPVLLRTWDFGSDKPMPWAHQDREDNPALGIRGVRLGRMDEGPLLRQLDAIAQAARRYGCRAQVMAPMVSTKEEALWFAKQARERGLSPGIMVEVPAVAILAEQILPEVDFVSIGTNDLSQYLLAADRSAPQLAGYTDPWQPALLQLVSITAQAGIRANIPVGVCGEAVADPLLACVLWGLGVTSLSVAASALPLVGTQLSQVSWQQCQRAGVAVLNSDSPESARAGARQILILH